MSKHEMELFEGLHGALGRPEAIVMPPEDFWACAEAEVDEDLVSLWREDGWARYAEGLFWTVDPRESGVLIGEWGVVPQEAVVFARTGFGNLYLLHEGNVCRLDPQWGRLADLGPSAYIFLNSTIKQPRFRKNTLQSDLFKAVKEKLGIPATDECYGLFPAVPLGGNEEDPAAYRRVKLREYLSLLAQMHR